MVIKRLSEEELNDYESDEFFIKTKVPTVFIDIPDDKNYLLKLWRIDNFIKTTFHNFIMKEIV